MGTLGVGQPGRRWRIGPRENHHLKRIYSRVQSPDLNAETEQWVSSVSAECFARLIPFGQCALRHALSSSKRIIKSAHTRQRQCGAHALASPREWVCLSGWRCRARAHVSPPRPLGKGMGEEAAAQSCDR
jgi:hypothetical protein